jgi:uncharacterized protein (TIGR03083 family)
MTPAGTESGRSLAALAAASDRLAALVQSLTSADGAQQIPYLGWTVADTAAHVVTVAGRLLGDRRRSAEPEETGRLNAICLEELADRDPTSLAARLRTDMGLVIERVYPKVDFDRVYPFHGGTTISGGGGAAFLLCELLVHGHDIASSTQRDWAIPAEEAAIAVRGPAEFWTRLLDAEGSPTFVVELGEYTRVEFPVRSGTVDGGDRPATADAAELLLAVFGRTVPSDERIATVLAALPQL